MGRGRPTEAALLWVIDVEGDPSPHHRAVIVANVDFQIASNPGTVSGSQFVSCHVGKRSRSTLMCVRILITARNSIQADQLSCGANALTPLLPCTVPQW